MIIFCALVFVVNCFDVNVSVDISQLYPFNRGFLGGVGSCHAITSLRADWREQLSELVNDIGVKRVRFHGLLDDEMSTVLPNGDYSFLNIFKSFDFLLSIGIEPLVELSFMPDLYASGNATIFYYKSNITPPSSVTKWTSLISALATALIDRYGLNVVSNWIFEVWNEPNCGFWDATMKDYYKLYQITAQALKSVSSKLQVAGPVTCQTGYLSEFLKFVTTNNVPLDVVTSHLYPSDPNIVPPATFDSVVQDAIDISQSFGYPFFLSEYNAGLNNVENMLDTSYAAAFVARHIGNFQRSKVSSMIGYSYWSFSDIFEEQGQQPQEFSNAFGMQTVNGVKKPVYRLLELVSQNALPQLSTVTIDGGGDLFTAFATYNSTSFHHTIFLSYFESIEQLQNYTGLTISKLVVSWPQTRGFCLPAQLTRIDADNANPFAAWVAMGSPTYPTAPQIAKLQAASQIVASPISVSIMGSICKATIPNVKLQSALMLQVKM